MTNKPAKSKGGRPSAFSESVVQKLEQAFSIGANDSQACAYAGIARQTFYSHLQKNPEFAERMAFLKQKLPLEAKNQLVQLIKNGDRQAILWYLDKVDRTTIDEKKRLDEAALFEKIRNAELDSLLKLRAYTEDDLERVNEYAATKAEAAMLRRNLQITGPVLISDKTGGQYTNPLYTQLQSVLARMDKLRDKIFPAEAKNITGTTDIREEFFGPSD